MVRRVFATAGFDLLALTFLYFVLQDLAWRASYTTKTEHLSFSTTYSLFLRLSKVTGGGIQLSTGLVSPPALDWVQVVFALLVVVNGLYVFLRLRRSSKRQ